MSDAAGPSFTSTPGHESGIAEHLVRYRDVREEIERAILPLAGSIDGRSFHVQSSLHDLRLRRGGYVVLEGAGGGRLGQITDLAPSELRATS